MASVSRLVKIGGLFSKSQLESAFNQKQNMYRFVASFFNQRQLHVSSFTFKSHNITENLQEFIANRNSCNANINSLIELQSRFEQPISADKKSNHNKNVLGDFINLLYMIKNEEDIRIPLEILKKNKSSLKKFPENRMVVYFSKFLYALKKVDQLADLLKNQELKELFESSPSTHYHILMMGLIDEQRHLEACQAFLELLKNSATDANSVGRLTPLIEVFAKSAHLVNSKEAIEITEQVIDILIRHEYHGFTNFVIHNYICMLCIKQNRPEIAKKFLVISTHTLSHNLSSIIHSQLNRIIEAFLHLEYIINSENKNLKKTVFQDTFDHLEEAIGREAKDSTNLMHKLVDLKLKAIGNGLLNPRRLDQHIELERIRLSKYTKEYLAKGNKRKELKLRQHQIK